MRDARFLNTVIPAKAGIRWLLTVAKWIPAFAGMTIALRKLSPISVIISKSYSIVPTWRSHSSQVRANCVSLVDAAFAASFALR